MILVFAATATIKIKIESSRGAAKLHDVVFPVVILIVIVHVWFPKNLQSGGKPYLSNSNLATLSI